MYAIKMLSNHRLTEAVTVSDETELNCSHVTGPKPIVVPYGSNLNTISLEDSRVSVSSSKALHVLMDRSSYLKSTRALLLASAALNHVYLRTVFVSGTFSVKTGFIKELYINYSGTVDIGECNVETIKIMSEHTVNIVRSNPELPLPPVKQCGKRALARTISSHRKVAERLAECCE